MRLYRGKVPLIAEELTRELVSSGDIEVETDRVGEVQLDIEAVLNEYRRVDREILEEAKDLVAHRSLEYSATHKIRQRLAEKRGFGLNDKAYAYITHQLLEMLLHTRNIEEVFADDNDMRKKMVTVIKRHAEIDDELQRQVKARIKNLQEGTGAYELEYEKVMGNLRARKGLD
ncbi:MAG: hypothetical protein ACI9WU_003035 [Myxococcota bacterium]|jgi:hypothetical protein